MKAIGVVVMTQLPGSGISLHCGIEWEDIPCTNIMLSTQHEYTAGLKYGDNKGGHYIMYDEKKSSPITSRSMVAA